LEKGIEIGIAWKCPAWLKAKNRPLGDYPPGKNLTI
jgi:hypothetical protein